MKHNFPITFMMVSTFKMAANIHCAIYRIIHIISAFIHFPPLRLWFQMSKEVQLVKFECVIHFIKDNITINDAYRCRRPVRSHSASHRNIKSFCTFRQRCPETKHPRVGGLQFIVHIYQHDQA